MTPRVYSYIRFSTPEQALGGSLRRQLERSQKWAEENDIEFDTSINLYDCGLSGYDGTNLEKGALGKFLELIKQGRIAQGSFLVVENLDRLTRQSALDALSLFTGIIRAGVSIFTLTDMKQYSEESIKADPWSLFASLLIMVRAHEESERKSDLMKGKWEAKRADIHQKKLTLICPEWLCLPPHRREYIPIPDRVEIVKQIYKLRLEGHGVGSISKILNETDRYWNPDGWTKIYLNKILRTPAVYGVYQPHKKEGKVRVPVGDPVPNYFPVIIPEETFLKVQRTFRPSPSKGGQNGKYNNLFRDITICGYCRGRMLFAGRGKHIYLVCRNAFHKKRICDYLSVHYDEIERTILGYCSDLDPNTILPCEDAVQTNRQILMEQRESTEFKITQTQTRIINLTDQLADVPNEMEDIRDNLWKKLHELNQAKLTLTQELEEVKRELEKISSNGKDMHLHLRSLTELYAHMDSVKEEERVNLRLRLRTELRRLIRQIKIWPEGEPRFTELTKLALLQMSGASSGSAEYKQFERELNDRIKNAKDNLRIVVEFTSGFTQVIYPRREGLFKFMELDAEARGLAEEFEGFEF